MAILFDVKSTLFLHKELGILQLHTLRVSRNGESTPLVYLMGIILKIVQLQHIQKNPTTQPTQFLIGNFENPG